MRLRYEDHTLFVQHLLLLLGWKLGWAQNRFYFSKKVENWVSLTKNTLVLSNLAEISTSRTYSLILREEIRYFDFHPR